MEAEATEEARVEANTAAEGTREKGAHVAVVMGVDEKQERSRRRGSPGEYWREHVKSRLGRMDGETGGRER